MTDKSFDAEAFYKTFPQFADKELSSTTLAMKYEIACQYVPEKRFGKLTEYGRMLLIAHWVTLDGSASASGDDGGGGAVTSKAVGSMSISYDTGNSAEADAGEWNATRYGREYYRLMRMYRRLPYVAQGRTSWP